VGKLIVTIDGPAASGKSTVASLLAEKLNAAFLDTGAMYRAVTLAAIQQNADLRDQDELLGVLLNTKFKFSAKNHKMFVSINSADVTEKIRDPQVTANARYIASAEKLREKLVQMQRDFAARHKKIVTEGRDQGTVAFPNANIKFYLTADPAERARRRQAELLAKGQKQTIVDILKSIEERDESDINRNVGPLKPADDAIVIDTTNLTIEKVVQVLLVHVNEKKIS
jgi:cytidylate kinase